MEMGMGMEVEGLRASLEEMGMGTERVMSTQQRRKGAGVGAYIGPSPLPSCRAPAAPRGSRAVPWRWRSAGAGVGVLLASSVLSLESR
jgi:hypothetical protein